MGCWWKGFSFLQFMTGTCKTIPAILECLIFFINKLLRKNKEAEEEEAL
jgi:hypothetical protein